MCGRVGDTLDVSVNDTVLVQLRESSQNRVDDTFRLRQVEPNPSKEHPFQVVLAVLEHEVRHCTDSFFRRV